MGVDCWRSAEVGGVLACGFSGQMVVPTMALRANLARFALPAILCLQPTGNFVVDACGSEQPEAAGVLPT